MYSIVLKSISVDKALLLDDTRDETDYHSPPASKLSRTEAVPPARPAASEDEVRAFQVTIHLEAVQLRHR